jgi:dethiobiotin synthetase
MKNQIFITGTDTGVGKTYISYLIAKSLIDKGINVGYFKPIETGCMPNCEDATKLASLTKQNLEEVVLFKFKNPVAPLVAEREERKKILIEKILDHLEKLKEKYEFLIVEGAGGIGVPITKKNGKIYTYLDFLKDTNLPTVIVARANLGTINHTYLTFNKIKQNNQKILSKFSISTNMSLFVFSAKSGFCDALFKMIDKIFWLFCFILLKVR